MRCGLALLSLATLAACQAPQPLFSAECNDGTRIAGSREVVESRCGRHRGVRAVTPLGEGDQAPPANGQGSNPPA